MAELSGAQLTALRAIALLSSSLSIIGSSLITASILKQHKQLNHRKTSTLQQLLLGLCMSDISCTIVSLTVGITNPKEFKDIFPWSRGTESTCSAFASLYILAQTAAYFYNMFMSVHFYRIVTTSKKRSISSQSTKRREWWFLLAAHSISNVIPLLFIIAGLITDSFHPHDFVGFCYFSEYPYGCDRDPEVECKGGQKAFLIARLRTGLITFIALISITATFMLAIHVRRNIERSNRYSVTRQQKPNQLCSGEISTTSVLSTASALSSRTQAQGKPNNNKKQREVAKQAICYVLASLNSFVFLIIGGVVVNATDASENKGSTGPFSILVLMYFFQPLQGALNFVVFIRPRYKAWKIQFEKQHKLDPENNPMMPSFAVILKKAILEQVPSGQQLRPKERKLYLDEMPSGQQPQRQSLKYASEVGFRSGVPATIPENFDLSNNDNFDDIVIEFESTLSVEDSIFHDVDESQIFGIDQDDTSAG